MATIAWNLAIINDEKLIELAMQPKIEELMIKCGKMNKIAPQIKILLDDLLELKDEFYPDDNLEITEIDVEPGRNINIKISKNMPAGHFADVYRRNNTY